MPHHPRHRGCDRGHHQRGAQKVRLRVHHRRHRPDARRHHRRFDRQGVRRRHLRTSRGGGAHDATLRRSGAVHAGAPAHGAGAARRQPGRQSHLGRARLSDRERVHLRRHPQGRRGDVPVDEAPAGGRRSGALAHRAHQPARGHHRRAAGRAAEALPGSRHRQLPRVPQRPAQRVAGAAWHRRCTDRGGRDRASRHHSRDEGRGRGVLPVNAMTWLAPARQWALLIALSAAIAAVLLGLHAPAALMLGPLSAAMILAARGLRVRFPVPAFVLAQGVIGCLIAKMVPLTIMGDILGHWMLFSAGVLFVVAASSLLGWLMTRLKLLPGTTALWGTSPGAASVMTIMAESYGADIRLVAVMQYLRVVLVAAIAAVVAKLFGVSTSAAAPPVWFPPIAWLPFLGTLALAVGGPLVARALRIPAGAFLVPMVLG